MNIKCDYCKATINPTANTHVCQQFPYSTGSNPLNQPIGSTVIGDHDITHRLHNGVCLNCSEEIPKYIVHEVHGEGGKTLDGKTLYWAKVKKS